MSFIVVNISHPPPILSVLCGPSLDLLPAVMSQWLTQLAPTPFWISSAFHPHPLHYASVLCPLLVSLSTAEFRLVFTPGSVMIVFRGCLHWTRQNDSCRQFELCVSTSWIEGGISLPSGILSCRTASTVDSITGQNTLNFKYILSNLNTWNYVLN